MQKIENLFEAEAASPSETAMLYNGGIGFRVPEYQRQYDWSDDNISRLFYDCLSGFDRLGTSPNADAFTFLGTMILVEEATKEADFAGTSVAIVDGQQRLTTLTLFACALIESIRQQAVTVDTLPLEQSVKDWIQAEIDVHLEELFNSPVGLQNIKGRKTFPFPRIIRSEDSRGRSKATSEYRSPLASFLDAFSDYFERDEVEFIPPSLGSGVDAKKLALNYDHIKKLVSNLNDADWYEDTECEQVSITVVERKGYRDLFHRFDDLIRGDAERNKALSQIAKMTQIHSLVRTLLFASYFSNCIVLTRVKTTDENAAFDIFDALNTTGEPLTALETLKPRVIAFEKSRGGFDGSASEAAIERITKSVDEKYLETSKKQFETKDLIVSFALFLDGVKLPENLAAQRNYLRTRYNRATEKSNKRAEEFVTSLADMAEFRSYYWTQEGIEELARFHPATTVDQVQLLVSVIKDMKTKLVLPILARYWSQDLKKQGDKEFLSALKAVTAFLVIRRAASGGTSGIDSDFRAIMAPSVGPGSSKKFGLCAGVDHANKLLTVDELKSAFRIQLSTGKYKIADKENWVAQVVDNPLYQQSRDLVRFLMLVAADRAAPSAVEPGCWNKEGIKISSHTNDFLNYKTWRSELYETVEHVAPDSDRKSGWDENIYRNNILRHSIGNLCLLPKKENSAIGNESWSKKRAFYLALTETTPSEQQERINEAAALGIIFSKKTAELLKSGERLSLLDPLRDVKSWTKEIIDTRGKNIAGLAWDYLWPWLK